MLYDEVVIDETIDSESAHEFLMEATKLASSSELEDINMRLRRKSALFQSYLAVDKIDGLDEQAVRILMRHIFFLRRKHKLLLEGNAMPFLRDEIKTLIYGDKPLEKRFNRFTSSLSGLNEGLRINLASELLHYNEPEKYWLWTNWVMMPENKSGALALVLQNDFKLEAETNGEMYIEIGKTIQALTKAGNQKGFTRMASGLRGAHIFLACVYAVYMFTVFKLKLSKEFNRILPELPELARRVLGVQKMEMN